MMLDAFDRKLLRRLQQDCSETVSEIADHAGLSKSACHRRIKALEAAGYITRYAALLEPKSLGYELAFSVAIRLHGQSDGEMQGCENAIVKIPEVMSCSLMTGQTDYLLMVLARNADDYEKIHHRLARIPEVANVDTSLILRNILGPASIPI